MKEYLGITRRNVLSGLAMGTLATLAPGCLTAKRDGERRTLRIAHCGDPQFGFSNPDDAAASYAADRMRFERLIDDVNEWRPDLCFLAGDMTHRAVDLERDWPRLLKRFRVPVVATAGNHDMGQNLTRENVERFERVFGYEYTSVRVGGWRFISGNSQYWRPTKEAARRDRYEAWLKAELASAKSAGEPIILATHMPPFVASIGEADTYENYPLSGKEFVPRAERFASYREAGVRFYLAGHTHRMIARALDGITILNAETTCRNFDGLPAGYRRMEISPDGGYCWTFQRI